MDGYTTLQKVGREPREPPAGQIEYRHFKKNLKITTGFP